MDIIDAIRIILLGFSEFVVPRDVMMFDYYRHCTNELERGVFIGDTRFPLRRITFQISYFDGNAYCRMRHFFRPMMAPGVLAIIL